MTITRRKLLAGAAIGLLGSGSLALNGSRPGAIDIRTAALADTTDQLVRVSWYERYTGVFRETQAGTTEATMEATFDPDRAPRYVEDATAVTDATGPVLSLANLLPGDSGTLVVGVECVENSALIDQPVDLWLHTAVTGDEERTLGRPETVAGDNTPDGELDEEVVVDLWRDTSPFGACNGRQDEGELPIHDRGTVRESFGTASPSGSGNGVRVYDEFAPGEHWCVALGWSFDTLATNRSQGDAVTLDLTFGAVPAGTESPFQEGVQ
jgi:hypothetical protein